MKYRINPFNAELNPTCHLLALLGAHPILHISGVKVKQKYTKHTIIHTTIKKNQRNIISFEMWCWRRMEKISWTDHVRNEEVLLRVEEQTNILHEIRKRKANWIGHILRRNCLLQRVIEGKIQGWIEVTEKQGRRLTKLLDYLKERRGCSHLKEEALDRTMWRAGFGRGFGPVVRLTTKVMNGTDIPRLRQQLHFGS